MTEQALADETLLDRLQSEAFAYFLQETNQGNGLVADKTREGWPASIAVTGMALAAYPVGVEHGFMTRAAATQITLTTLQFFIDSRQSAEPDATGYKGFYYHFLDITTGRRAWRSELSMIDTAFLLAGALTAAAYFDQDSAPEQLIRTLADQLYRRTDWRWAQRRGATLTLGWTPERRFLKYRWQGYDEALLLYVLGLGSPTYPLAAESYAAWVSTNAWKTIYDYEFVYAGPMFIHQLSQIWIDCRGIQDRYMQDKGIDYFENSRRATCVQQEYAIRNPREFASYGKHSWGITASDGPGPAALTVDGRTRRFFDYVARGVPFGPDDGTLAPWAVAASLPFAPAIVLPTLRYLSDHAKLKPEESDEFMATFNPTYPATSANASGWVSPWDFGLSQGPIVLMIENYRSGLVWRLMRQCPYVVTGLRRAGFAGGWL